jgi:predicted MFS family arabinose efflux permease
MGLVLFLVMMPLSVFIVRDSPESMGLAPDGWPAERAASIPGPERTNVTDAVQTASFWQLAGALSTCGFTMSLLAAHGVPMLTDHGYSSMLASGALGLLGGTGIGFAVALGAAADRFGCRPVLVSIYGGRALAFLGLFLIRDHAAALLLVAALGGATMGGTFAMTSALTANIFGRYSVGSVFGTMFLVHQTGAALGSWLGGFLFELTGGYGAVFAVGGAILAAACLVSLTIDEGARALPALSLVAGGR